jgi:hypothetical protein
MNVTLLGDVFQQLTNTQLSKNFVLWNENFITMFRKPLTLTPKQLNKVFFSTFWFSTYFYYSAVKSNSPGVIYVLQAL